MNISDKELEQIAYLARIGIEKDSFQSLKEKLSNILNMVNELNKVDTKNISPMSHPLEISQPLRNDQVTEENHRESLQEHSPLTKAGLFLVPKVIDKEE
tara:strand:- start:467 stop:763 length:297 start_codon:yes stop_codon:yes gene_type:complete